MAVATSAGAVRLVDERQHNGEELLVLVVGAVDAGRSARRWRRLPALALVAFSGAALAGAEQLKVLGVGMDTRQPPWAFVPGLDYSGENARKTPRVSAEQIRSLEGFDVDVMNALARRLGVQTRVVPVSWFDLEKGLLAGRYDLILSSWTPSPETPEAVLATVPYCDWGLLVTVRADNRRIVSYRDLDGARVGHYRDPTVEKALRAMGHGQFAARDLADTLFDELKRGELDAVIFDSLYVRWRVARDRSFRVVGEPLNRLGYHVGVRKEDTTLFARVQAAIKAMLASGEMARIRRKWEG